MCWDYNGLVGLRLRLGLGFGFGLGLGLGVAMQLRARLGVAVRTTFTRATHVERSATHLEQLLERRPAPSCLGERPALLGHPRGHSRG